MAMEMQSTDAGDEALAGLPPIEVYLNELASSRQLPDVAVGMCTLRFPESAPALRAILARAADGEKLTRDEETLLFRGLYILGGRRDQQSFAPLLRFLRRPAGEVDRLLGDAVTESLSRIVTGVFDGNVGALLAAIADCGLDQFIRDALMSAATFLAWEGRIPLARMTGFLERFYYERLAEDEDYIWIGWLEAIALLGLRSLAPLVTRAWDEGRIAEGIMERKHFKADLERAEREPGDSGRFREGHFGYIEDVIVALDWTRYGEDEYDDRDGTSSEGDKSLPAGDWQLADRPAVNPWRDVGRNDPCPCGSGKKFKKCCL